MAVSRPKPFSDLQLQRSGTKLPNGQGAPRVPPPPPASQPTRVPRTPIEPAPRGLGSENLDLIGRAIKEAKTVVEQLPSGYAPRLALLDVAEVLGKAVAMQRAAVLDLVRGEKEAARVAGPAIRRMADAALPRTGGTFSDREAAKEDLTKRELAKAEAAVGSRVTESRKNRAAKLVKELVEKFAIAEREIKRARLHGRFATVEADADLMKRVETHVAALPTAIKASAVLEWFQEASAISDEPTMRAIAAAGLPVIQELLEDTILQKRVAAFSRAGVASKLVADATAFVTQARSFLQQISRTPEVTLASAALARLRQIAIKTCGVDAANPDVTSAGQFSSLLHNGLKTHEDGSIAFVPEDSPRWVIRFARSSRPLPAFGELVTPSFTLQK